MYVAHNSEPVLLQSL